MTTRAEPLGLRLFLEGIEVPVIAVNVDVQPDGPASASVQIIPTDMGLALLPRTLVHVFYLDPEITEEERLEAMNLLQAMAGDDADISTWESEGTLGVGGSDFAYKILFAGEVIGYSYSKNASQRQLVLQCLDLSSYWDSCYQYFADYSYSGNALTDKQHHFVAAGEGIFDNFGGHKWVISELLNSKPRTPEYQKAEGLLGGLIHLLEVCGGIRYRGDKFEGFKGINDFFTVAELRYNLLGQIGAIEKDKTSKKLYAKKAFNSWLRSGMTSMGTLVSFRDILNQVNRWIFHNIYPNPCAMVKSSGVKQATKYVKVSKTIMEDSILGEVLIPDAKKALSMLSRVINLLKTDPDSDNLATAVAAANDILKDAEVKIQTLVDGTQLFTTDDTEEVYEKLLGVLSSVASARNATAGVVVDYSVGIHVEGVEPKGSLEGRDKARSSAEEAHEALFTLLSPRSRIKRSVKKRTVDIPQGAHYFSQLFLPETFFVSPPRCNVIFPDVYTELSYSRVFLREVSRLCLNGGIGLVGRGQGRGIFGRSYLAPNIKDVRNKLLKASLSEGTRVILPHELHSGIIPKYEWAVDGHRWGAKAAAKGASGQDKKDKKIRYLQRLANFQFFLHRWSARQLSVSGKFNPYVVAGFPGVVIDRSLPAPAVLKTLQELLGQPMMPLQFVGKIHSYRHSLNQTGGATSVQFVYARTHRGLDDEFLHTLSREVYDEGAQTKFPLVEPKRVASQPLFGGRRRHLYKHIARLSVTGRLKKGVVVRGVGKMSSVEESGESWLTLAEALELGVTRKYFDDHKQWVRLSTVTNAAETNITSSASNDDVLAMQSLGMATDIVATSGLPDDSDEVTARNAIGFRDEDYVEAILGKEKVRVTYRPLSRSGKWERTGAKFEDVVRPEWMAEDVWDNDHITEAVYGPLLGTLAITDDKAIGQAEIKEVLRALSRKASVAAEDTNDGDTDAEREAGDASYGGTIGGKDAYIVVPGSVEETIDGISAVYGMIRTRGGDVGEFIRNFTRRPIGNIVDVLGTPNLEFTSLGKVANTATMREGYHSRAYGDYNTDVRLPTKDGETMQPGKEALAALMDGADAKTLKRYGILQKQKNKKRRKTAISPEVDPRGRARGRVRGYVAELSVSRGLSG